MNIHSGILGRRLY